MATSKICSTASHCPFSLHPYLLATESDAWTPWKRRWRSCHESSSPKCWPAQHKAWTRLLFMWLNFLAALHGHSCIIRYHDNKAGPAFRRSHCLCTQGVRCGRGQTLTDLLLMPHGKCVRSMSQKRKAPDQPMRFCFLCGLYWCLLSTYILIYLEKTGDIQ